MEMFHVIGEKEYSTRLFEVLDELVRKEQMHIIKNKIRHSGKQLTILMYSANFNESQGFKSFGDYDHFSFFNDNAIELLDANGITYNKVGECTEDDLKRTSLMIRNYRFI